jgi:hypothetical protein
MTATPKKYDVNEINEVANALVVATEVLINADVTQVTALDGWCALAQILESHPEWNVIKGWVGQCFDHLWKEGRVT